MQKNYDKVLQTFFLLYQQTPKESRKLFQRALLESLSKPITFNGGCFILKRNGLHNARIAGCKVQDAPEKRRNDKPREWNKAA